MNNPDYWNSVGLALNATVQPIELEPIGTFHCECGARMDYLIDGVCPECGEEDGLSEVTT